MMKALLGLRFRAMFAGLTAQARKKNKSSAGMIVLFTVLYLYVGAVLCGMMGFLFWSLAEPYHSLGLDWLYFTMAGLMGLGFAVIGSVFSTQSQLYDAKDNALLLSMPIPPRSILISRMVPLLALNLVFAALVMVPAMVVYAITVSFSLGNLLLQLLTLASVVFLAQAIASLLGWLLHLLLSKMNKSAASMLYMIVFLVIYFWIYSQANGILSTMATQGEAIARSLQSWVWPLYAMGMGCIGNLWLLLVFALICAVCFGAVWAVLSATFLRSATAQRAGKRRKLDLSSARAAKPADAIVTKELRKFLSSPVYLTNMGLGIVMVAALCVAGLVFRNTILEFLSIAPFLAPFAPMLLCAALATSASTICISTPSVSLEGKNIWILKSMPVASRDILLAKLRLHCGLSVPVSVLTGGILAIAYGFGIPDILLCALIPGLLCLFSGVLGLVAGLKWARLDYISEAYPCKQSASVMVTMFSMMGVPVVFGFTYFLLLYEFLSPTAFLALCAGVLLALCLLFFRVLLTWGVKKWEQL